MINFKIYDVTNWTTYNHNTHSTSFSRSKGKQAMKFGEKYFSSKTMQKMRQGD